MVFLVKLKATSGFLIISHFDILKLDNNLIKNNESIYCWSWSRCLCDF